MKKVIVFLAEGFEEIEALTPVDYLRRVDILVDTVSITDDKHVKSSHNVTVIADKTIKEVDPNDYDGLYIPGGLPGATNLRDSDLVIDFVKKMNEKEKLLSAICAGPIVLDKAGVLEDKKVTSFPAMEKDLKNIGKYEKDEIVVTDGNIITGRGAAAAIFESFEIIEKLEGKEKVEKLKEAIQHNKVEQYYNF